jgi:hypothetical protein
MLRLPPGHLSSVPADHTQHAHLAKVRVVPCSMPVAAAGQGRSVWLAKCKVLLVSSSVIQVSLPWMAAPRHEKRDERAGCGLRSMEPAGGGVGPAKLGRDGQEGPRAVRSWARRRRLLVVACCLTSRFHVDIVGFCAP